MMTQAPMLMDEINRRAWRDRTAVRWFAELEGPTDPGEGAALASVADEVRGQPILDLGVGGGRTVPMLLALSKDYVALDYTPELVDACRRKYPAERVLLGDARDLARFADETFQLVVFSFNGIDAVNAEDRARILAEAFRVLRKGGVFLFSAHNREGPGHNEKLSFSVYPTRNPLKLAYRFAKAVVHGGRILKNHARYSRLNYDGEGYSIKNAAAHDHGILIHYTSLQNQLEQLGVAGFEPAPVVFGNVGPRPLSSGEDTTPLWWFHFLARKGKPALRPSRSTQGRSGASASNQT